MKNILTAIGLATLAPLVLADTSFGVYAGTGLWHAGYNGDTGVDSIDLDELSFEDEDNSFLYIAVEHPLPILPNIKLQHTHIESREAATLSRDFTLDTMTFTATDTVVTDLDISHTDAALYYQVLDNRVNLDLGLTLRAFSGTASVQSDTTAGRETLDLDTVVPLLYVKTQLDLPFTGLSLGTNANIAVDSDNSLSDVSVRIAYASDSATGPGFELGYRRMALDDLDDLAINITLDGPYVALTLHF